MSPLPDHETCYRAVASKDSRFDGWFVSGVTSTGIYCRPSCPATTPKPGNVRFYATAAGAQRAGFRACLRCRPDTAPGSPEWNWRHDLVGRAMRLINDGVVDREGVGGLARRLGYTERHLNRQLTTELGAGPLALARAQRAQTARLLIETTTMPFTDIAFAAGFASIRQFNATVREVFAHNPTELRSRAPARTAGTGFVSVRLAYRPPFDAAGLLDFFGRRALAGIEEVVGETYRRVLRLPHGLGVAALTPVDGYVRCELRLDDLRDLTTAVQRCRRLLDTDTDPGAVADVLATDPALAPLVRKTPGLRLPGAVDVAEQAVRAVVGQQVSVVAARTVLTRLARAHGEPVSTPDCSLTHAFPTAAALADVDDALLPMPAGRRTTLRALCAALAEGAIDLSPGADPDEAIAALRAVPGVGPWTASYIAMRALSTPDVFLADDVAVRRGATHLDLPADPAALAAHAERWRPWRSYAVLHLWSAA